METLASNVTDQVASTKQPRFSGTSHVSLPCRDLDESKLFYSQVLGGELFHEIAGFVEYRIADIVIGLSEQDKAGPVRTMNIRTTLFISTDKISS